MRALAITLLILFIVAAFTSCEVLTWRGCLKAEHSWLYCARTMSRSR